MRVALKAALFQDGFDLLGEDVRAMKCPSRREQESGSGDEQGKIQVITNGAGRSFSMWRFTKNGEYPAWWWR
jgi:hypothetical protein